MNMRGLGFSDFTKIVILLSAMIVASIVSAGTLKKASINYAPRIGSDLTALDIYTNGRTTDAPVLIYVHGGGWKIGDKARVKSKPAHFVGKGFVFISLNYRLVPKNTIDDQISDIDRALKWIHSNISKYGGNPDNLHLMGHSAGARLVTLTATAPLGYTAGLIKNGALRSVISNDIRAYDVPRLAALFPDKGLPKVFRVPFGNDPADWRRLSPIYHLSPTKPLPAFLIMYSNQGDEMTRRNFALSFAASLKRVGAATGMFHGKGYSHREINVLIGKRNRITTAIDAFLAKYR